MEKEYKWGRCHSTCDVNNHFGYLHNKFTSEWNPDKIKLESVIMQQHQVLPNVLVAKNAIPIDLAKKLRKFVQKLT